ncbi:MULTISPECIES: hypothetical protein [Bacillota]|uniref:hypothetical protein n=1 Tax=Bacillota TaxID=1239 RepID=UPI0039EEE511
MKKLLTILMMGLLVLTGCGTQEESKEQTGDKILAADAEKSKDKGQKTSVQNQEEDEKSEGNTPEKSENQSEQQGSSEQNKKEQDEQQGNGVKNIVASNAETKSPQKENTKSTQQPTSQSKVSQPTTNQAKTENNQTTPKSETVTKPAPAPAPKPQPAPAPKPQPAPTPKPAPAPQEGSMVTKVQNALPGGYTAKSDGSSVIILRGGAQIASTLPGTVGFSASLNSSDINAALKGASALGGSYSQMRSVTDTLLSGEAFASSGGTSGLKRSGMIFITW